MVLGEQQNKENPAQLRDKRTQEELSKFFEEDLVKAVREEVPRLEPIKQKFWHYGFEDEFDTWPNINWWEEDWHTILNKQLVKMENRLARRGQYQQFEDQFQKMFPQEQEPEEQDKDLFEWREKGVVFEVGEWSE